MHTVGFPISHKENENRRAILPIHIKKMSAPNLLWFETGYGNILGIDDKEFLALGCHICSREEILNKDIICDPKIGDADYLEHLQDGKIIFGWIHAIQNRQITDNIINNRLTAYAWEDMHSKGRHVFWRNNELAGEAAILHAFQCFGLMPYDTSVAVIGKGNTARGAIKILNMMGAKVTQYDRKTESLLRDEIGSYNVIVNCVLWDISRKDHIIYATDLKRMKKGAMIIDVSCDNHGGIETSVPTTIENPTYVIDNIVHYAVDHTPSIYYKTFTHNNSEILYPYLEELMLDTPGEVLKNACIVKNGEIIDQRIILFQNRSQSIKRG